MCDGSLLGFMKGCCHEGCIIVERDVVSIESFLSSEEAGRSRITRRESITVRRDVLFPGLSPLKSLAKMTSMDCIWRVWSSCMRFG